MLASTFLLNARALIDEENVGGVELPTTDSDIAALEQNGIRYLNMALREVYKFAENVGEFEVDNTGASTEEIYTIYTMPSDFASLREVVNLTYGQNLRYKWVGFNKMYVNNTYLGKCTVIYNAMPTEVTSRTDEVTISNPLAIEFINNFIAARMANKIDPDLVNFFEQKSNEILFKAQQPNPAEEEELQGSPYVENRLWGV